MKNLLKYLDLVYAVACALFLFGLAIVALGIAVAALLESFWPLLLLIPGIVCVAISFGLERDDDDENA